MELHGLQQKRKYGKRMLMYHMNRSNGEQESIYQKRLVVGYKKKGNSITALVDSGDIHCLMIGAAGVGKTANFLYPNIEYACASGMSFLTTDTKGDLFRNYAGIAKEYYG